MRQKAAGEHLPWHALPEPLVDLVKARRGPGWEPAYAWMAAKGFVSEAGWFSLLA